MKGRWYWHIHHDRLCEVAMEPIARRRAYIRMFKPKGEVVTRLRLLNPVRGKLPVGLVKAGTAYVKAGAAYDKAWDAGFNVAVNYVKAGVDFLRAEVAYNKAGAAYLRARAAAHPALEVLHRKECRNCPWDGKTIFPRKKK